MNSFIGSDEFQIVMNCLRDQHPVERVAVEVTQAVACPTIGIGASAQCDGQVLVTEDMLGMFERVPKFVKRYEEIAETISGAAARYA